MNIEAELKKILGDTYGGPAIAVNNKNEFVLYTWTDAPVSIEELVTASSLEDLVMKYKVKGSPR